MESVSNSGVDQNFGIRDSKPKKGEFEIGTSIYYRDSEIRYIFKY